MQKPLTEPQLAAVALHFQGLSQAEIADRLGKHERTIHTWLHLPQSQAALLDFAENYRERQASRVEQMQAVAHDTIEEICQDRDQSAANRIAAARLILSLADCCQKRESADRERIDEAMLSAWENSDPGAIARLLRDESISNAELVRRIFRAASAAQAAAANAMATEFEEGEPGQSNSPA